MALTGFECGIGEPRFLREPRTMSHPSPCERGRETHADKGAVFRNDLQSLLCVTVTGVKSGQTNRRTRTAPVDGVFYPVHCLNVLPRM